MKITAKKAKIIIALLLLVGGIGGYFYFQRGAVSTDDAAIEGQIVTISPKVQGYVKKLNMADNQLVKAGDVLAEIDSTDYVIRRDKAKAALAAAEAAASAAKSNAATTAVTAPSNLAGASAQVAVAAATWEKTSQDLSRMESLFGSGAVSRQQLDDAVAAEKSARSTLEKTRADQRSASTASTVIAASQNTAEQLAAQVQQARVDLAQAESDLANTKIVAPIDGRITKRSVELGNYVQAGQQLSSLVGTELWIVANFKETQLAHMRVGQKVHIKVDAFPDLLLNGTVDSLQAGTGSRFSLFPAENATGNFVKIVQRVPVKIRFDSQPDATLAIGPGMSVLPTVETEKAGW
ncbi:MAG: HlyD family secretion protein [Sporomusaceae bacterium]|nr:HlyD family secretion protein [Sporomusaceae bacterium]